jgi:hypothetical protein
VGLPDLGVALVIKNLIGGKIKKKIINMKKLTKKKYDL